VPGAGLRRAGARGGDVPGARALPLLRRRGGDGRRGERAAPLLRPALLPYPAPPLLRPLLPAPRPRRVTCLYACVEFLILGIRLFDPWNPINSVPLSV
jgi:hypothetical protein